MRWLRRSSAWSQSGASPAAERSAGLRQAAALHLFLGSTYTRGICMNSAIPSRPGKRALVLAGGGVTGAMYEIGALRALDDALRGFSVTDFDIYVGTSAGALVAACLANRLSPHDLVRHLEMPVDGVAPLRISDLFAVDGGSVLRHGARLPEVLLRLLGAVLTSGGRVSLLDALEAVALALPGGIYDGSALERYLAAALSRPGLTNDFRRLPRALAIIATDLDSSERVVFGEPPLDGVPISRAVAASSAVPILYRPVRIEGRDYVDGSVRGNASLDLAIERGATLIVCVNPLVPFDRSEAAGSPRIHDMGAPGVASQVFRTFVHAGLHYHLKQIRRRHPEVDVVLIEPGRDDLRMFSEMPMRYASRVQIVRHGYESVARHLAERSEAYRALFARHGIDMQPRDGRDLRPAAQPRRPAPRGAHELRAALNQLEQLLDAAG